MPSTFVPTTIDTLELDACLVESPQDESEVTEHPVEKGSTIVDHVRPRPVQLTLEGIISNTPINRTQAQRVLEVNGTQITTSTVEDQVRGQIGYAEEAYAKLIELKNTAKVITVTTPRRTYTNLILKSLSAPRDAKTGDALHFTAGFQEIRIVQNKTTTVVVAKEPKAHKKQKRGHQVAKPNTQQQAQDALKKSGWGSSGKNSSQLFQINEEGLF